jgi:hypothetical protein
VALRGVALALTRQQQQGYMMLMMLEQIVDEIHARTAPWKS